jgi:bis(5'-adenosyl)-triphosphatase
MVRPDPSCPFDGDRIRRCEFAGDAGLAAIYNIAPILPGHSLVIPRRHAGRLAELDDAEVVSLFVFARRVTDLLLAELGALDFDWSLQDGASAGQTVPHAHLHVIPRSPGDLPGPGDWHPRLQRAIAPVGEADVDSASRARLSDDDMDRIVRRLRSAAARRGLGPGDPPPAAAAPAPA